MLKYKKNIEDNNAILGNPNIYYNAENNYDKLIASQLNDNINKLKHQSENDKLLKIAQKEQNSIEQKMLKGSFKISDSLKALNQKDNSNNDQGMTNTGLDNRINTKSFSDLSPSHKIFNSLHLILPGKKFVKDKKEIYNGPIDFSEIEHYDKVFREKIIN